MRLPLALINRNPDLPFADFKLKPGTYTVGRSSVCDLPLCEATISRRHAELTVGDNCVLVTDLKSRNGTYIQGEAVTTGYLQPGQEVRFGRVKFLLVDLDRFLPPDHSDLQTADFHDGVHASPLPSALTPSQMKVLACLLEGMTEKSAGLKLGISHHTVHNHVREIYAQLNVRSRGELMAKFIPPELHHLVNPQHLVAPPPSQVADRTPPPDEFDGTAQELA